MDATFATNSPMIDFVWIAAVMSSATAGGVALSHVLEVPGKHRLAGNLVAEIQQGLYPGFRYAGMVLEPVALLTSLLLTVLLWNAGAAFWLSLAAAIGLIAMGAIFPTVTEPMNRRIAEWDPAALPGNWQRTLRRWELSHGARAVLMLSSATLLVTAAVIDGA